MNKTNIDNDWMNNPVLEGISKDKFELLKVMFENSKNIKRENLIPFFISESSKAASKGIFFNNEETNLIMDVLTKDMNEEQKKKVESLKKFAKMMVSKNSRKQ
ncbi:MAG: hypothetical protein E7254_05430 [Lachnospiraceae bacterium]|nr:hypothetical protein [Lachnospiraceae bacterium]